VRTSTGAPTPVAICCANRLFRDALAAALTGRRPDFTVVGDVGDPGDLLSLCRLRAPELVLCCVGESLSRSLSALSAVRVQCARSRLVLIYRELSRTDLIATRRAGVDTLIPCSHGLDALVRVLGGQHPGTRPADCGPTSPKIASAALTDLEQEIVALLAAGHPVGRIACLLGVGTRVVENHKRRIYQKLAVSGQNQLAARAATLGLAGRPPVAPHRARPPAEFPLVVVRGASGPIRDDIETALLAARVHFDPGLGEGAEICPGARPSIMVVVDPVLGDWIRMARPGATTLLVRSVPMSREEVLAALGHGVVGVVAAHQVGAVLVPALQLAAAGHLTLEAFTGAALATAGTGWGGSEGLPELTVREADILRSIARGHTVRQTARSLGIAVKTVENTQARLFRKLGARNRAGALATAHALGLLELLRESTSPGRPGASGFGG
jgi:two-component system nitrate/nitrite response regulator NarL